MRSSLTLAFSSLFARSFASFAAFSSSLRTGRPLASRMRVPECSCSSCSASSASCSAAFISRARLMVPIMGMNRSPPKIAPNTSSGSTNPPSGALSFGPYSLYFFRSASSERVYRGLIFIRANSKAVYLVRDRDFFEPFLCERVCNVC
jgi:hypothetical protein